MTPGDALNVIGFFVSWVGLLPAAKATGTLIMEPVAHSLVRDGWHDTLKREVPREEIPVFLSDLQALVAELRRWRDAQRVPTPPEVAGLLTPLLREHADLTVGYVSDPRYQQVLREALEA